VSGGGHRWFKRSTGEKRPVTRDDNNDNNNNNNNNNNNRTWREDRESRGMSVETLK
jgi:hypothetical protein